jgi:hypothetical protein
MGRAEPDVVLPRLVTRGLGLLVIARSSVRVLAALPGRTWACDQEGGSFAAR